MSFILDSELFRKTNFEDEGELESFVQSRPETIFGENVIYLPQKYLQTPGGAGTVPEAVVIDLLVDKWYIVEVELVEHGIHGHIATQVTKQLMAADNPEMKRKLTRTILREIEKSENSKKKLADRGIPEIRIHETIERIMDKKPVIVIPIDAIPPDFDVWAKMLNRDVVPIVIEKFKEVQSGKVAYLVTSSRLIASPEIPEEEERAEKATEGRPIITEEEFLRQSDEPGRKLYKRLKELAKDKKHELKPSTQSFSYYVISKSGKFCPLVIWPSGVTINKIYMVERKEIRPDALSKFRERIMRIGDLANKYDTMKIPGLSAREGDLSDNDIDLFVAAFKELIENII
jgi:hypothetical protein